MGGESSYLYYSKNVHLNEVKQRLRSYPKPDGYPEFRPIGPGTYPVGTLGETLRMSEN